MAVAAGVVRAFLSDEVQLEPGEAVLKSFESESRALEIESGNDLGCEGASALLTEDLVVEFRFRLNHLAGAGRGLDGEGFGFGEVIRAELHWQKY